MVTHRPSLSVSLAAGPHASPGVPLSLPQEIIETMAPRTSATSTLNRGLRIFFSEFVRVSLRHPRQALFFARTVLWQGRAARLRARVAAEGITVPPIVIFSITNGCS